jgi:hypothetical protein
MKNLIKNKKIFFSIVIFEIFVISLYTLAGEPGLELTWPPSPATHIILTPSTPLPKLVQYFYEWGIALGGLAAFISLVIGGFQYLTSMGEPARIREAKDRIYSAFLGLILLLGSWLILNTINPQLTSFRLPSEPFGKAGQLECDTDSDCSGGYKCTDQNPGDGKKEGICVKKAEEIPKCEYAIVTYEDGSERRVNLGEIIEKDGPKSVKSFCIINGQDKSCCDEEAIEKGYYSCKCYLQLFAGKPWYAFWTTCGDLEAVVPGCETRIINYTDKPIHCVKLISSSW